MTREMREVCKNFEEVTGWRIPVLERAGRSVVRKKAVFSIKVPGVLYTCLVRQVNKGVKIQKSRAQCLMNSKTEFHQHPVVRVVPVRGLQEEQGEAALGCSIPNT